MNPREAALLSAAATLLSTKQDVAYGPAHAVADALALEKEVSQQAGPFYEKGMVMRVEPNISVDEIRMAGGA